MAEHPLRALFEWPLVIAVGLALTILGVVAFVVLILLGLDTGAGVLDADPFDDESEVTDVR